MSLFRRTPATPPPPSPDPHDLLICAPGVAESVACATPAVAAALAIEQSTHPDSSICAAYIGGTIASQCEFADKCRIRPTSPPRLA